MLIYETLNKMETITDKEIKTHRNKTSKDFLNFNLLVVTDIKILNKELKQVKEIYNNIDANTDNILNGNVSKLAHFYITYGHFKKQYQAFKKTDVYINNGRLCWITSEHMETLKELNKYLRLIIRHIENNANTKFNKNQIEQLNKKYL